MTPKELHESYIAKATQAEANAAAATDQGTKENWLNVAETFRQLAKRLK
ncbi:MAG TPA: hypothetical protein VHX99_03555 [Rhizomicrobium sp.]|jgi:hypothetical protein|nr:hypothetical protein [Rhizomicrobium sp.]